MNSTCTPPVLEWPGAPTAMSRVPSPSKSADEADSPNRSPADSEGPSAVEPSIFCVDFAVPSALSMTRYSAPAPSPRAPTAMSGIPSESASPMPATPEPNSSPLESAGPPPVLLAIFDISSMLPSGAIITTYAAPRLLPPASSPRAPTAKSDTPSPLTSPSAAAEYPNLSPGISGGPASASPCKKPVRRSSPLPVRVT